MPFANKECIKWLGNNAAKNGKIEGKWMIEFMDK
jgi:hypothetical protein